MLEKTRKCGTSTSRTIVTAREKETKSEYGASRICLSPRENEAVMLPFHDAATIRSLRRIRRFWRFLYKLRGR
jgi:hypothetical protein